MPRLQCRLAEFNSHPFFESADKKVTPTLCQLRWKKYMYRFVRSSTLQLFVRLSCKRGSGWHVIAGYLLLEFPAAAAETGLDYRWLKARSWTCLQNSDTIRVLRCTQWTEQSGNPQGTTRGLKVTDRHPRHQLLCAVGAKQTVKHCIFTT